MEEGIISLSYVEPSPPHIRTATHALCKQETPYSPTLVGFLLFARGGEARLHAALSLRLTLSLFRHNYHIGNYAVPVLNERELALGEWKI